MRIIIINHHHHHQHLHYHQDDKHINHSHLIEQGSEAVEPTKVETQWPGVAAPSEKMLMMLTMLILIKMMMTTTLMMMMIFQEINEDSWMDQKCFR